MGSQVVEWIASAEACGLIGKSSKTLERLASTGEIQSKMEPVPGRKSRRVFFAADVERLAHEGPSTAARKQIAARSEKPGEALLLERFVEAIENALPRHSLVPAADKAVKACVTKPVALWLTEQQAHEYSQLSIKDLRSLVATKTLTTRMNGRSLRYQRRSLELFSGLE